MQLVYSVSLRNYSGKLFGKFPISILGGWGRIFRVAKFIVNDGGIDFFACYIVDK